MARAFDNDYDSIEEVLASIRKLMAEPQDDELSGRATETSPSSRNSERDDEGSMRDPNRRSIFPRHQDDPERGAPTLLIGRFSNRFGYKPAAGASGHPPEPFDVNGHAFAPVMPPPVTEVFAMETPSRDPPRSMPNLRDSRVAEMGESGAWRAMTRALLPPPGQEKCKGPNCFGPLIPPHLVPTHPATHLGGLAQQANPAALGESNGAAVWPRTVPDYYSYPTAITQSTQFDDNLDDATASLLRPLLRQWLDNNMARMLDKALQLESKDTWN